MTTVLVTGANRGLGLEFVRQYAERNYQVISCCRNPEDATHLQDLSHIQSNISIFPLDVTDENSVKELSSQLEGSHIDLLINNAGVLFSDDNLVDHFNFESWRFCFEVNVIGPMRVTQQLLPYLKKGSKVIQLSSRAGSIADNERGGLYSYRASKAALNQLNKSFSIEIKPLGITTISIHPGWVKTEMGGEEAPLLPPESVMGMIRVIDQVSLDQTGGFYDYRGEQLPW